MNTPITKAQMHEFKMNETARFLITGSGPNRRSRRMSFKPEKKGSQYKKATTNSKHFKYTGIQTPWYITL